MKAAVADPRRLAFADRPRLDDSELAGVIPPVSSWRDRKF
jgi:hypothetical protein